MSWDSILQSVVTVGSIMAAALGFLGKTKYQRILQAVIQGVEAVGHKETKAQISAAANLGNINNFLDQEILRVTGKAVKKQR